ncbi:ABC transporter permease subunit [Pseudomonas aeruginosa]|uniref:ABC transporter permease subunit n=1 Tax=Pseudomonas aeruginosa TaxID=287 RepID=UPI00070938D3|nr:ABC transporter permease subunit [Pseudomonas aeruginosa]MBI8452019.1 ABC transporter permease subunit [Pseudomonas aeruginosa]TEF29273.1 ABC transporter permease subunit [Pseudomonas aeruginosa]TEF37087.1 ABC transporter permease subunit [Pseudomonas aeruginosa]SOV26233.1 putative glutamine ABC transporter permease prote in GlnM [Pseudomonas aeruginosa]HEJ2566263.1 ABC transporter permease subunit [Pseudomonas aeruginosa]
MNSFDILWENSEAFAEGLLNTLILFGVSAVFSFMLACFMAFLLEGHDNAPRKVLRWVMDVMRMLPFLIYLYLLYYGLPDLGVRLDVWAAGFIALITYHGAYFAEILRAARTSLPVGQAEAAYAHGFVNSKMYWRILLPQMVMSSGPLFGNQLVCLIKDTAFLSIITLTELTAAANAVQAKYFIPLPPFVLVIVLYWMVTLFVEAMLGLLGRLAKKRGLVHE